MPIFSTFIGLICIAPLKDEKDDLVILGYLMDGFSEILLVFGYLKNILRKELS